MKSFYMLITAIAVLITVSAFAYANNQSHWTLLEDAELATLLGDGSKRCPTGTIDCDIANTVNSHCGTYPSCPQAGGNCEMMCEVLTAFRVCIGGMRICTIAAPMVCGDETQAGTCVKLGPPDNICRCDVDMEPTGQCNTITITCSGDTPCD